MPRTATIAGSAIGSASISSKNLKSLRASARATGSASTTEIAVESPACSKVNRATRQR